MSQQPPPGGPGREPTEEELRAAYEAELARLTVDDVLLQTVVSLVNLGAYKLQPPEGQQRDLAQVRVAVDAVRALLPVLEPRHAAEIRPLRDALSQLQMAYVQEAGAPGPGEAPPAGEPPGPGAEEPAEGAAPPRPGEPGPAQRSGRLWVPGQ